MPPLGNGPRLTRRSRSSGKLRWPVKEAETPSTAPRGSLLLAAEGKHNEPPRARPRGRFGLRIFRRFFLMDLLLPGRGGRFSDDADRRAGLWANGSTPPAVVLVDVPLW